MNPTDPPSTPPPAPPGVTASEEPDDFKAMLIGAGCIFVITFIPYAVFLCCLPQIFGALLALHVFTRRYQMTLTYGEGIKLGILTTLLGGLSAWVVAMALLLLAHYQVGGEIQPMMLKLFSRMGPEVVDKMKEAIEAQKAHGMTLPQLAIGLLATGVNAAITGLIGGAIGTAWFKRGPKPGQ